MLTERGFQGATIREIADRAGVNPALLHYYFGTKSGLHQAVIEQVYDRLREMIQELQPGGGSARDQLRELIRAYIRVIGADPYVTRMLVQEMIVGSEDDADHFTRGIGEMLSKHLSQLIEEGMDSGEFREIDLPFPFAAVAPHMLFFFLVAPLITRAGQANLLKTEDGDAWADEATNLIFYGICGEIE